MLTHCHIITKLLTKRQQHIDTDNINTSSETENRDAVQQSKRIYKPNGFDVVDAFTIMRKIDNGNTYALLENDLPDLFNE